MKTYRVLARLLDYPEAALTEAAGELAATLDRDGVLTPAERQAMAPLLSALATRDLLDLQSDYVDLFDRVRSLSLNLFEHVHGDSRDRGQAMAELVDLYRRHGLDVTAGEMPDHLPLVLEFLSVLPLGEARQLLSETAPIIAQLAHRLDRRGSPYAPVLQAILRLAGTPALPVEDTASDDDSPEALDRAWEEAAVTFGPESAPTGKPGTDPGCGRAAEWVARMSRT